MAYFIEVNGICILFLSVFLLTKLRNMKQLNASQRMLRLLIIFTLIFCFSDMFAGVFRGSTLSYARAILILSNIVYFESLVGISFTWLCYTYSYLKIPLKEHKRFFMCLSIPAILITLIILLNPWTHIMYEIDAKNLYQRHDGVVLHWIVTWFYFLFATGKFIKQYAQEKYAMDKRKLLTSIAFVIPPTIASVIQMRFYGITITQAGITLSILLMILHDFDEQIFIDPLTNIQNRKGLEQALYKRIQQEEKDTLLMMIDIDAFKSINDQYGHVKGDAVLCGVANALQASCSSIGDTFRLFRYGGDEFVILGDKNEENIIACFQETFHKEMNQLYQDNIVPQCLSISIGSAHGKMSSEEQVKRMIEKADRKMYRVKSTKKGKNNEKTLR